MSTNNSIAVLMSFLALSIAGCGGGGGSPDGSGDGGTEGQVLALSAGGGQCSVTLVWTMLSVDQYNLCQSSKPVSHFDNCYIEGGQPIDPNVGIPPHVVRGLTDAQTYYFRIEGVSGSGRSLSNEVSATPSGPCPPPSLGGDALNDTGITSCGEAYRNNFLCTGLEPSGQDAHYGRDAGAEAGTLTKTGGGISGFDFTKIANNGEELPASAALGSGPKDWACTRDNVTGLIWEVKVGDQGHLRHNRHRYTWYDPNSPDGKVGVQDGGFCAGSACDTTSFVQAVNAQGLCGASDWRMPTWRELQGIVDYGWRYLGASVDPEYFPNTVEFEYWSGSPFAVDVGVDQGWVVEFESGRVLPRGHEVTNVLLRLVRSVQ